jgi:hypothetical protein
MVSMTSGSSLSLDMYETGFASGLVPDVTQIDDNHVYLGYSSGLSNVLKGYDLKFDELGFPTQGYITCIQEYCDGNLVYEISGANIVASRLADWLGSGDFDYIFGTIMAGNDTIRGGASMDRIFSLGGNDFIEGRAGDDLIEGGSGDDELNGGDGDDDLYGGDGNDRLTGGTGSDIIEGGSGSDVAIYDGLRQQYQVDATNNSMKVEGVGEADVLSNVESISFRDGSLIFDENAIGSQVVRLYDAVLGRAPDNVGLDYYLDQIEDRGGSLLGVANELIASAEFQMATGGLSNAEFVDHVYYHTLERLSDSDGHNYYTEQLDHGSSRGNFVLQMSESFEHRAITNEMLSVGYFNTDDVYQSVALLYDGFAGRLPDRGGLAYYAERVKSGAMTLAQVTGDLSGSVEFLDAIIGKGNGEIVDYIYQNTLHRLADTGGRDFYTAQLDNGANPASVLQDLALSFEHYILFSRHITNGIDTL